MTLKTQPSSQTEDRDKKETEMELSEMTRNQLRDAARERGLATSGNKTELVERIREHDAPAKSTGRRGFMSVSQRDAVDYVVEAALPTARESLDGTERPSARREALAPVLEKTLANAKDGVVKELVDHLQDLEDNGRPERAEYIKKIALRELNKAVQA